MNSQTQSNSDKFGFFEKAKLKIKCALAFDCRSPTERPALFFLPEPRRNTIERRWRFVVGTFRQQQLLWIFLPGSPIALYMFFLWLFLCSLYVLPLVQPSLALRADSKLIVRLPFACWQTHTPIPKCGLTASATESVEPISVLANHLQSSHCAAGRS